MSEWSILRPNGVERDFSVCYNGKYKLIFNIKIDRKQK